MSERTRHIPLRAAYGAQLAQSAVQRRFAETALPSAPRAALRCELTGAGHDQPAPVSSRPSAAGATQPLTLSPSQERRFHKLYCEHFDFVFRNLRRLGVPSAALDDALQDVYIVVLRRIRELPQNAHDRAWIFAILFRVASNHRRSQRRRGRPESLAELPLASLKPGPFELTACAQAAEFLHRFLDTLDENRRAVFIMSELEQLTAPEIARALDANVNTVYSWMRMVRLAFVQALQSEQRASEVEHG